MYIIVHGKKKKKKVNGIGMVADIMLTTAVLVTPAYAYLQ